MKRSIRFISSRGALPLPNVMHPAPQKFIDAFKNTNKELYLEYNVQLLKDLAKTASRLFGTKPATVDTMKLAEENFSESMQLAQYICNNCDNSFLSDSQKSVLSHALSSYAKFLCSTGNFKKITEAHQHLVQALVLDPSNQQAKECKSELEYNYSFKP